MGVLAKLSRRMFRSRLGLKHDLTMSTTTEGATSSENADRPSASTNGTEPQDDDMYQEYADEPPSPHHGPIITTPAQKSNGSQQFFSDDFDAGLYDDEEDDETSVGPMILLHASNCSSSASGSGDEGDITNHLSQFHAPKEKGSPDPIHFMNSKSGQQQQDEMVLEPSFEVALMHSQACDLPVNKGSSSSAENPLTDDAIPDLSASSKSEVLNNLLLACPSKPQRRFDHSGRPFVHIYAEGLPTVDESYRPSPIITGYSKTNAASATGIDDTQIQARWALAREQLDSHHR